MKKLFLSALMLLVSCNTVWAQDIPYQDPEFSCTLAADANRYVADFGIDVKSFGGLELCNSNVETKKLFNDIQILEQGRFANNTENKFIAGFVESNNYYGWLKNETRGIERGNDIPYATAYNSGGYFTMQDGWAKLSTLGRVGTFVHEARHTAGFRHIRCNQGPYQGSSVAGCDTNYSYGGSHAVEMEYYARVSVQGANFHPVYKKMARLMAIARSNVFFNTPIIQTREAVLALTQDRKEAHLFDNGNWYKREVPEVAGRLKRTSFGAVLFDGLKALAIELYQNSGFTDVVNDTYSYYKLLAEKNESLKDFEEFDSGVKRYAVKITNTNKLAAYDFPSGVWGNEQTMPFNVARTSTATLGKTQSGLYIVSTTGEVFNYQPQSQRLVSVSPYWNPENKEVIAFKGQNLVLKNNGQIQMTSGNALIPWTETNRLYSGLIATPVYDGFEVVKE
jgi:hypothetical protein